MLSMTFQTTSKKFCLQTGIWERSTTHEARGTPIKFYVIREEQHGELVTNILEEIESRKTGAVSYFPTTVKR